MCVFLSRAMIFFGPSLGGDRPPRPPPVDPPLVRLNKMHQVHLQNKNIVIMMENRHWSYSHTILSIISNAGSCISADLIEHKCFR